MERWQGKIAVVTGASSGIGAATAVELTKQGLTVVAVARRIERIEALQSQVANAKGKLHPKQGDVSKEDDIVSLFQWIKDSFGTVHVLINNAGVARPGRLTEQNPKYWRDLLDLNVVGLSICTQQTIKLMRDTGVDDGQIIHISSLGHEIPAVANPYFAMYPASKFAVRALTETLRQELRFLKSKIRISCISPGMVATEFGTSGHAAIAEEDRIDLTTVPNTHTNLPRLQSQDLADGVVYILSTPPRVQVHELYIKPVGGI